MSEWARLAEDEMSVKGYKRVSKQTVRGLIKDIEKLQSDNQRLREAVINAYECGHNDTVESNYCDARDRAEEIIAEALKQEGECQY